MQISMNVQHLAPMTANRIVTTQLDHTHVVATQATPLTVMVALAQVNYQAWLDTQSLANEMRLWLIDINECSTNNGGCEQRCNNRVGSYSCGCNAGYSLDSDQRGCSGEQLHGENRGIHVGASAFLLYRC